MYVNCAFQSSLDSETSPEDEASRASGAGVGSSGSGPSGAGQATPPQPPNLALSLHALSTPRPPENLAPGLVEQLPSEGTKSVGKEMWGTIFKFVRCIVHCIAFDANRTLGA